MAKKESWKILTLPMRAKGSLVGTSPSEEERAHEGKEEHGNRFLGLRGVENMGQSEY